MATFCVRAVLPIAEISARYIGGSTVASLAKEHHVGFGTIHRALGRAGVPMRPNSWNRFDAAAPSWLASYASGESLKTIAGSSGADYATVRRYLLLAGVTLRADSSVPAHEYVSPCAGAIRVRGSWELAYAGVLDARFAAGSIRGWKYETARIPMPGGRGWYTPDFEVATADGTEFHEVKGWLRPSAMLKMEYARRLGNRIVLVDAAAMRALQLEYGFRVKL